MKTKEKLIKNIIDESKIHHNITISWGKMPQEDGFDWQTVAGDMLDNFATEWEFEKMNDCGNRNLCECKNKVGDSICKKHDLWHVYTAGRSGATLYWDKYWTDKNTYSGFYEYDLQEKSVEELKEMLKEIVYFKDSVKRLMEAFYSECEYRVKEQLENQKIAEKIEKEYQSIKTKVEIGRAHV